MIVRTRSDSLDGWEKRGMWFESAPISLKEVG